MLETQNCGATHCAIREQGHIVGSHSSTRDEIYVGLQVGVGCAEWSGCSIPALLQKGAHWQKTGTFSHSKALKLRNQAGHPNQKARNLDVITDHTSGSVDLPVLL